MEALAKKHSWSVFGKATRMCIERNVKGKSRGMMDPTRILVHDNSALMEATAVGMSDTYTALEV